MDKVDPLAQPAIKDMTREQSDRLRKVFQDQTLDAQARARIEQSRRMSEGLAARILAARECPEDVKEWGRRHGIPTFAEFTWEAGFLTGMMFAQLMEEEKRRERATD